MTIDAPPLAIEGTRKRPRLDTTRRDEGIPTLKEEQQPPFKRIRFAATSSGQIKTLSIPADLSHTDLNKNDLWWTRADRSDISEASREIVKDYKDSHPSQVEHLIHVFQQCAQKPSASTSEYLEQATACVPPIVRGLEWVSSLLPRPIDELMSIKSYNYKTRSVGCCRRRCARRG
jgi:hypothetical protein